MPLHTAEVLIHVVSSTLSSHVVIKDCSLVLVLMIKPLSTCFQSVSVYDDYSPFIDPGGYNAIKISKFLRPIPFMQTTVLDFLLSPKICGFIFECVSFNITVHDYSIQV